MTDTAAGRTHPRSWGEFLPPVARWQLMVLVALVVFAYWTPIVHRLVGRWTTDGNWSHGFIVPLFSLYFLYSRQDEMFRTRPRTNYLGLLVLLLSLVLYLAGTWWLKMSYPQTVSLVGVVFGLVLFFGGWDVMRIAWFPILFLLFAIPLPDVLFVKLTMPLRTLASSASAIILPVLVPGLQTESQRVVIDYVTRDGVIGQLNVEEACSGLRLMMSFLALGVAMAYMHERPIWQRIVMVVSCIPIAVFCNTVRVTVTGVLHVMGHAQYARGTPHQLLGIFMLLLAFAMYAAVGWVLGNLFVDDTEGPNDRAVAEA